MWPTLIVLLIIALNPPVWAQERNQPGRPLTKEQIEKIEDMDRAMEQLGSLQQQMESLVRSRGTRCLKAFGHQKFCSCVNDGLAVSLTFQEYVMITSGTKDDLGYAALTSDQKKLVDNALKVREQCVKTVWGQ